MVILYLLGSMGLIAILCIVIAKRIKRRNKEKDLYSRLYEKPKKNNWIPYRF